MKWEIKEGNIVLETQILGRGSRVDGGVVGRMMGWLEWWGRLECWGDGWNAGNDLMTVMAEYLDGRMIATAG